MTIRKDDTIMDPNAIISIGIPLAIICVVLWRKIRPYLSTVSVSPVLTKVIGDKNSSSAWIDNVIDNSIHMLVIGATGGGKTTLLHKIAATLIQRGVTVVVLDPDALPSDWAQCYVYGAGDNYEDMERAIDYTWELVRERREMRADGIRNFDPLYIIMDEYADIHTNCENMLALTENLLRRANKLNIHVIIGVQDKQVLTLGFERKSKLLIHATTIEVQKLSDGQRTATINDTTTHVIPSMKQYTTPKQHLSDPSKNSQNSDFWRSDEENNNNKNQKNHENLSLGKKSPQIVEAKPTTVAVYNDVLRALRRGEPQPSIAARLRVSTATVNQIAKALSEELVENSL